MSKNDGPPEEQGFFRGPISRRSLVRGAAVGGMALSTPALLAACGGDDDEEAADTTATTAAETTGQASKMTFYSVTHGESGNVFWAIYRNGIRDGGKAYGVTVKDLPLEQFAVAGYVDL